MSEPVATSRAAVGGAGGAVAVRAEPIKLQESPGKTYLFFREGCFYVVSLHNDVIARKNAECNPGTLRVEDINRRVVWRIAS